MKLQRYGFAAALVLFTALPALARSYDVCMPSAKDLVLNTAGQTITFVAVAPVFSGGTIATAPSLTDSVSCNATQIGTFFATGGVVAGFPASGPNDEAYVNWHFRINNQGAFDTSGLVETTASYTQTITGSTNFFVAPFNGTATVTNLAANAFRVTVGF
jgi:hypothetical protein